MRDTYSNLMFGLLFATVLFETAAADQHANVRGLTQEDLSQARALIQEGRRDVIREELRLNPAEEADFWVVYYEYRGEVVDVMDRKVDLIADYLQAYDAAELTNKYADKLIDEFFDIKDDHLRIEKKYLRRFKRVLPSLKVAQFYQLENKMNAEIDAELALVIPVIEVN